MTQQQQEDNHQDYYYRILGTIAVAIGATYLLNLDAPLPKGVPLGESPLTYLEYTE